MLISRLAWPVTNLGFGRRAGIWTQGCTLACPACMAMDTWGFREDRRVAVEDLARWLVGLPAGVDGVTVSGGEPTQQPDLPGVLALIRAVAAARDEQWDVLVFTGLEPEAAEREHPWLAELADVVVAGPFVADLAGDHWLRGSSNQRLLRYTELARKRYVAPPEARPALEVTVEDGHLSIVGIPRPGELAELRRRLAERGIRLRQTSWKEPA